MNLNISNFLFLSFFSIAISCVESEKYIPESQDIKLKLKNGSELDIKFLYRSGKKRYKSAIGFGNLINEVKRGNTRNINKSTNHFGIMPLSKALHYGKNRGARKFYSPDSRKKTLKLTRYLLENGADPNLTEVYFPNCLEPDDLYKKGLYNKKTKIMKLTPYAIRPPHYFKKRKIRELTFEDYKQEIKKYALFLTFGAKLSTRGAYGKNAFDYWPKGENGKDFATRIIKELMEEDSISKLDDKNFIEYAESCEVGEKYIEKLKEKVKKNRGEVTLK